MFTSKTNCHIYIFLFLAWILLLLIIVHSHTSFASKRAFICEFEDEQYNCHNLPRHISSKLDIPPMSCVIHDCHQCIKTNRTFIVTKDFELLIPTKFLLRQRTGVDSLANSSNTTELVAFSDDYMLINPTRIIFETCLIDKRHSVQGRRRLLENESARFTQHNLTFQFQDPVLTLPDIGKVILRTADYEHIMLVPEDLTIVLPFELLAFRTTLTIIYLHPKGYTVTGNIHLAGKSVCQLRQCILCRQAWDTIHCWPKALQYTAYCVIFCLTVIGVWCVKFILRTTVHIIKLLLMIVIFIWKFLKATARACLLLGALIGNFLQTSTQSSLHFLENAARRAEISQTSLVLLAICLIVHETSAECSTHSIIKSEVQNCETLPDKTQMCKLFTTAEITLPAISSETCMTFTDNKNQHLFSLRLTLEEITCDFHTNREYFTFPVKTRHISQVSCIFNRFCGKGTHCLKRSVGLQGLRFEAETPESREFPGVSSCSAGGLGVGCTVLTRAACNFFRTWYEPDLLNSYEVSAITGHQCRYHIAITHQENNTMHRVIVKDTTYTSTGIKISVLGAFDQPQLHLSEAFVQRVGRPDEAYLAPTSRRNFPQAGYIGAVQANASYTKSFIFDPEITNCDFFEDVLRCQTEQDPVERLQSTKEYALPLQKDMHHFHVKDGKLTSSLLSTAAVKVQLSFSNYKIAVQTITVCPTFSSDEFVAAGCYNCPLFARLTFSAHSTCQSGAVFIDLQNINVHTKVIYLNMETKVHTIKFLATSKCYEEKLCLRSYTLVKCHLIKFCLEEPSVELLQLNTNYTMTSGIPSNKGLFDWMNFSSLNVSFYMFKFIGSVLFVLCIIITITSTFITCCCRAR